MGKGVKRVGVSRFDVKMELDDFGDKNLVLISRV